MQPSPVSLDTSVLIWGIEQTATKGQRAMIPRATLLLEELDSRAVDIVITAPVVAEYLSGFGQTGPYHDFETTDLISAATGGLAYVFGDADRPPVRISSPQSFFLGAQHAAERRRRRRHRHRL